MRSLRTAFLLVAISIAAAGVTNAQVPPEIAKQLVTIGRGVCVPETAQSTGPCIRILLIRIRTSPAISRSDPIR